MCALKLQPVTVAIAVNSIYIHSYASGIIDASDCFTDAGEELNPVNHAVLNVGYGTDEVTGLRYWLLKNSWNTTWGDKGYFKIKMDDKDIEYGAGRCGIHYYSGSFPIIN